MVTNGTHPSEPSPSLGFKSLNDSQPTTIVLLHGFQSSYREWDYVVPELNQYHLLLPDLPGHASSSHVTPYTIPHAAKLLASLIRTHARNGAAHIVGLSLGGFIARKTAQIHPELVLSLFVTGAAGTPQGWKAFVARRPRLFAAMNAPWAFLPEPLMRKAMEKGLGMKGEFAPIVQRNWRAHSRVELFRGWVGSMFEEAPDYPLPGVRVAVVAGGRQDDLEAAVSLGKCLREGGGEKSGAFVVREAIHAWNLQLEMVFAEGIVAWVEGKDMPDDYEDLLK